MISVRPGQHERPGQEPPASSEIKAANGEEPHAIPSNPDESVFDSTAETLIAMLRTSTPPEPGTPRTFSKLAAAPAHLRSAFKKAWMTTPSCDVDRGCARLRHIRAKCRPHPECGEANI